MAVYVNVDFRHVMRMKRRDWSRLSECCTIYIKEDIVSYEYYELSSSKSESIWAKIKVDKKSEVVVGTCYKSPSSDSLELRELYDAIAQAANKEVLIMGDFNFPYIN